MIETSEFLSSDLTSEVQTIQTEEFVSNNEPSTEERLKSAHLKLCRKIAVSVVYIMAETGYTYETMAENLGDPNGAKTIKRWVNNLIEGKSITFYQMAMLAFALDIEWDISVQPRRVDPVQMNDA